MSSFLFAAAAAGAAAHAVFAVRIAAPRTARDLVLVANGQNMPGNWHRRSCRIVLGRRIDVRS